MRAQRKCCGHPFQLNLQGLALLNDTTYGPDAPARSRSVPRITKGGFLQRATRRAASRSAHPSVLERYPWQTDGRNREYSRRESLDELGQPPSNPSSNLQARQASVGGGPRVDRARVTRGTAPVRSRMVATMVDRHLHPMRVRFCRNVAIR